METTDAHRLARAFHRLGWAGLWIQAAFAIAPLVMLAYLVLGKATGARPTWGVMDYLALVGLAILAFTAFWSFRYTRLAKRMADPARLPTQSTITRTLWIGLWASCAGIAISLVLLVVEVVRLLILFLKAPQAGVPIMRTELESRATWVSSLDVVTLLAELCTLVGELVVLGFTLWLLFAVTRRSNAFAEAGVPADA